MSQGQIESGQTRIWLNCIREHQRKNVVKRMKNNNLDGRVKIEREQEDARIVKERASYGAFGSP